MKILSIVSGKAVSNITKNLNLGAGSTWPGHIALKADPRFVSKFIKKNPHLKVILIAGTNGKTTTTKTLQHILENNKINCVTNSSGANLINGLASILLHNSNIFGKTKKEALIFEVDENTLPLVLAEIPKPDAIVLLNLFRDQLDRYGEVNATAEKWKENIEKLAEETFVIANADDPQIASIGLSAKSHFFYTINDSFKKEGKLAHSVDSITCPICNNNLVFEKVAYSHLGNYKCANCNFKNPITEKTLDFSTNLKGSYNRYNISAALLTAQKIFDIPVDNSILTLKSLKPAFGRQETINVKNKKVMLLLSKNPTGFNESIKVASKNDNDNILILLNDRIPDGRDISWIWDVDFENLKNKGKVFVSGDRSYDMANRLYYAGVEAEVFESYKTAYKKALGQTGNTNRLIILPTYSAMLKVRKLISGKAIL